MSMSKLLQSAGAAHEIDARAGLAERLLHAVGAEAAVGARLAYVGRFGCAELQQVPLVDVLRLAHTHLQQVQLLAHEVTRSVFRAFRGNVRVKTYEES